MRELSLRCRKILFHILRTRYPYSKLRLWITWLRLIAKSIGHHKFRSKGALQHFESILNHKIHFAHYGSLIDLFEEIFVLQAYRAPLGNTTPFIIDAGSNIGMSILYFKTIYPDAMIVCFEPDSQSFELLSRNVLANRLENVSMHQLALSDAEGKVKLFDAPGSLNSGLYGSVDSNYQLVPSKKLSSFIDREVDLLKIDIEGAEDLVITDLINSGKINLIKKLIIEHHPNISHFTTDEFIGQLRGQNFKVAASHNELHPDGSEVLIWAERP
jgi:FkbM family methyltransferase